MMVLTSYCYRFASLRMAYISRSDFLIISAYAFGSSVSETGYSLEK
jgi:hypothetical protein